LLVKAQFWLQENFRADSCPDVRTVKKWIKDGTVAGEILGEMAFVEDGSKKSALIDKGFKLK